MSDRGVTDRFRGDLLAWFEDNERTFPWRDDEATLYEVFMSEMFLRRTRADVVESFIPAFLERYPDVGSLRDADVDELAGVIRPMGLQNTRARGLTELAEALDGDDIPTEVDGLLELPQVGSYVANATLCFGLDRQLPIVDRNVDRVYGRLLGDRWSDLPEEGRWWLAEDLLPDDRVRGYNLALLDFAAAICKAPSPDCEECFASSYCTYYAEEVEGGPQST